MNTYMDVWCIDVATPTFIKHWQDHSGVVNWMKVESAHTIYAQAQYYTYMLAEKYLHVCILRNLFLELLATAMSCVLLGSSTIFCKCAYTRKDIMAHSEILAATYHLLYMLYKCTVYIIWQNNCIGCGINACYIIIVIIVLLNSRLQCISVFKHAHRVIQYAMLIVHLSITNLKLLFKPFIHFMHFLDLCNKLIWA